MTRALGLTLLILVGTVFAGADGKRFQVADFSGLEAGAELPAAWEPATVARISRHTDYRLESVDGVTALRAEADASMSSLLREIDVDPHTTPWLHWRWRIAQPNRKSDLRSKSGDDFPVRLYVFFDFDLKRLSFFERTKLRIARALYGDRLPLAALCYVWASDAAVGTTAWNAYTDRVRMVVATSGAGKVGEWVAVERNVVDDFRAAFGEPVPRITGIALASDTDDTGEYSLAWYGDIAFDGRPRQ